MSPALVLKDVGMEMRVMGAPAYYPLIEAGKNWYECKAGCELILDDTTGACFCCGNLWREAEKEGDHGTAGTYRSVPIRPQGCHCLLPMCHRRNAGVVVKDLGFGEMFPSSGKVWDELVEW